MNINKINENSENSESIVPDIFEQIKKRNEEFSTSEASKLLQSITNPTNLTNPQIINSLNRKNININKFHLPSLKNKIIIKNVNNNAINPKYLVRSSSDIESRNIKASFFNDPFDLRNYQTIIKKAEKIYEEDEKKKIKKIIDKINRNNNNSINFKNNLSSSINLRKKSLDKIGSYQEIWEKLKQRQSTIKNIDKNIRINNIKFIPRKQFIEKCNTIRLANFTNSNKNERYQAFLSMKKLEIKSADNLIKKLENSKDFLENKYEEQHNSYILYLKKVKENETFKRDNIIKEKINIMKEIHNLEEQVEKIKNKKRLYIDWIYLQIRVKNKILILPNYYKYIIEDNIPYEKLNEISDNYQLKFNEYNKILNYKTKCIYDDADYFMTDFDRVQMECLNKYNQDDTDFTLLKNEMRRELKELKEQNEIWEKNYNQKFKQLSLQLKYLINKNEKLLFKLNHYRNEKPKNREFKDSYIINKLSIYANMYSNFQGRDIILRNDKPTLFYIVMCLYHIVTSHSCPELKSKKLFLNLENIDTDIILKILEYTSLFIDLVNKEKYYLFSNKKNKELYKKIKMDVEKKTKKERLYVNAEMKKIIENDRMKQLKEKLNKNYYRKMRKIDFYFQIKEKKIKNKSLDENIKTKTKFEDFLYDVYS